MTFIGHLKKQNWTDRPVSLGRNITNDATLGVILRNGTADNKCSSLSPGILELVENTQLLLDFVSYFSRFPSFRPIFTGPKFEILGNPEIPDSSYCMLYTFLYLKINVLIIT